MEKRVNIGGREVMLKATAKLPIIFEAQFGKSYMQVQDDLMKIVSLQGASARWARQQVRRNCSAKPCRLWEQAVKK